MTHPPTAACSHILSLCSSGIFVSFQLPRRSFLMPATPISPSHSFRLSKQGFQSLNDTSSKMDNRTADIPLQTVVSHSPSQSANNDKSEKDGAFHKGRRRLAPVDSQTGAPVPPRGHEDEKTALNRMGRIYTKILNYSIVTRYMIYVAPIALILAIPIILSQAKNAKGKTIISGTIGGSNQRLFWIWIELSECPDFSLAYLLTLCSSLA